MLQLECVDLMKFLGRFKKGTCDFCNKKTKVTGYKKEIGNGHIVIELSCRECLKKPNKKQRVYYVKKED